MNGVAWDGSSSGRWRAVLAAALFVLVCVVGASDAVATRRVIVRLRDGSRPFGVADRRRVEAALPVRVTHALSSVGAVVVEVADDADDWALLAALDARSIEPDVLVQMAQTGPQTTPWGVERVRAPEAWAYARGVGIRVGVIDSGIDTDHPDLVDALAGGYNTLDGEDPTFIEDLLGHGTHVAGIIAAADNGVGVVGVAPGVSLYAVRVFGSTREAWVSDIIQGLEWCVANGMHVVNMSLGLVDGDSQAFEDGVAAARAAGVVLVAAAGNHKPWDTEDLWVVAAPASYPEVIAVSAVDATGALSSFSNFGPEVDFAAPGSGVESTYLDGTYSYLQGTSMACPHVTGVVALALEAGREVSAGTGLQLTDDLIAVHTALTADEEGEGVIDGYASVLGGEGVVVLSAGVHVAPEVVYAGGESEIVVTFTVAEVAGLPVTLDEVRLSITDAAGDIVASVAVDAVVDLLAYEARAYSASASVLEPGAHAATVTVSTQPSTDLPALDGAFNPVAFSVYRSVPSLIGPVDGVRLLTAPLLAWDGVFAADLYEVDVLSPDGAGWEATETADTQLSLPVATPGEYRWRVRALAGAEWLGYSDEGAFSYGLPAPTLTAPATGGVTYDATPTLSWDVISGAATYGVEVATDSEFLGLVGGVTDAAGTTWQYVGDTLTVGGAYYWRARATSPVGLWSARSTFTYTRLLLTMTASPAEGGVISPADGDFALGDSVTVSAAPTLGFSFDGWSGAASGSENPLTISMAADMAITALFVLTPYVLTTEVDPAEGGVVTASGATFTLGETATLTAVPATGYEFVHWDDEPASTGNPATFTVTGDATHKALFRLTMHTVTARSEPAEGGVVAPALVTAEYGSVVDVTATAASAFLFDGWGGAGVGIENPLAVLVTRDTELIANFVAKPTATLAFNGAEAALNERSVTVSARVAPGVGAEVVAAAFSLTYDTAEIASLVVDEEQATAAGWTVTQLALPGRVDVSALAVGPPSAAGFAFSVSVAAADGYWGEADVSVADVSLNQDGVVTVSTSGSVFFPRVSVVAAPAAVGEPAVWSANIVVPSDASSVRVFYRRGGDAQYTAAPMTPGSSGVWTVSAPLSASTMRGIAYYMTVSAHDGREYASGTATSPVDIPVRGEESIALIPTVYAPSRWNLVAPTATPDLAGAGDAFGLVGPAYSAFAGTASSPQWLAWRWQATEQEWRPAVAYDQYLASTDGFVPGSPWFVVVEDDASLDFTLGGVSVDATADFVAPLRLGWNLLSNPFAYPVDWSDASVRIQYAGVQTDPTTARSRGWVHDRIFWYDHESGSYLPQASGAPLPFAVSAGQGFWLYASVDGAELAIPGVEAFPVDPPVPPAAPSLMTADQWQVGLAVGSWATEMSATAAVGRGGWSLEDAIPPGVPEGGGPRVALVGDADGVSMQLRRSVRPESDAITWRVQVDGTADAVLRWDISSVPDEYSVTLEGDHGGDVVDLRANADIAVGDLPEGELTLRAARRAGGFSAAGLHPNYPNPFNPETWIPFTLPRASEVTLSVYASDGALVRTLPLGRRAAGAHVGRGRAAYWDGRAASGEAAASGVYFYEIRADGLRGRRRMVLQK